jgi:two-component sensor histidine kinase
MNWLAGWDFPSRLSPALPTAVAQLLFALLVTVVMILVRMVIDLIAPGAGALSLLYPAVMIATLFGRWFAGLLTLVMSMGYSIYFVLPMRGTPGFGITDDGPRIIVNLAVLTMTILLLEIFRGAIAQANAERDRQIEQGKLLLRELDHRVKNNFMAVSSLLQMQRQRAADSIVRDELETAIGRVEGIAAAHRFLYHPDAPSSDEIDMTLYLGELCSALDKALLRSERIALRNAVDKVTVHRDRAISIGLIVNELVTNAARHAFPDDRSGTITVSLRCVDKGLDLVVEDDGRGMASQPREGSLGRRLIAAFVREARGELQTESSPAGTRCTVRLR